MGFQRDLFLWLEEYEEDGVLLIHSLTFIASEFQIQYAKFMFSNLFFLIIVLLLVNIAIDNDFHSWLGSPLVSFGTGLFSYCVLLVFIYLQTRFLKRLVFRNRGALLFLVNLELIAFLAYFHFVLGAHRFFFIKSQASMSVFALLLYFGGLGVFHYSCSSLKKISFRQSLSDAWRQLRFLAPFVIPFLLFAIFLDLLKLLPISTLQGILINHDETPLGSLILFFISIGFLFLMMVFLPPMMQWIWGCKDLEDGEIKNRLDVICEKAHFRHAGFKTWTVMDDSLTAAIIGIVPRFRYIMFTKRLLKLLPVEAVEAILTHEIGHSYRRHLLIYPIIIFGMVVICGLFSLFFSEGVSRYLELHNFLYPSNIWQILNVFMVFIPYALIIALYFRYIFGYFSRTFERQADLHGFILDIPPKHMLDALDTIAIATGHTHDQPSWHHYSIRERMDFLEMAKNDPNTIAKHHRKAKISLCVYLIALGLGFSLLVAPLMPDVPFFKQMTAFSGSVSHRFSDWLNSSNKKKAAEKLKKIYQSGLNAFFSLQEDSI